MTRLAAIAIAAAIPTRFNDSAATLPRPAMQYSVTSTQALGKNGTHAGRKGIEAAT